MTDQDQEITLGTGRLLGLFFGLVVLCALFFSLGFSLGRRSASDAASAAEAGATAASAGVKPSAIADASKPSDASAKAAQELTFYKAVEQNEPKAKLDPVEPPPPQVTASTVDSKPAAPELTRRGLGSGYMVQVAAVTKQEDADALVNALRKKSYPVLTTGAPNDKLYHVQVGPFPDVKEAEATRAKLIGDGYNPILKK